MTNSFDLEVVKAIVILNSEERGDSESTHRALRVRNKLTELANYNGKVTANNEGE